MSEPFLLRYHYVDGTVQAALPLHVVEDEPERRVGWLIAGTRIGYWATADGADPRRLPLESRFSVPLGTAERVWEGTNVLRVMPKGEPYQVLHFWQGNEFKGWYVNFESPSRWEGSLIETRDWHLDLWVDEGGAVAWKDIDEAEVASRHGHVAPEELTLARHVGELIASDVAAWLTRIGDWRRCRPPSHLGPLPLPRTWLSAPSI